MLSGVKSVMLKLFTNTDPFEPILLYLGYPEVFLKLLLQTNPHGHKSSIELWGNRTSFFTFLTLFFTFYPFKIDFLTLNTDINED